MAKTKSVLSDIEALGAVLAALTGLDERQRAWVIASATANLGIPPQSLAAPAATLGATGLGQVAAGASAVPGVPGSREHAKAFFRKKMPTNLMQRIACLAYYL